MSPTIDTESDGSTYLYSKQDKDNETGRILAVTNHIVAERNETTALSVQKIWIAPDGKTVDPADTVDYAVTFEIQRRIRGAGDPTTVVYDAEDTDGWTTIAERTLTSSSWTSSLSDLITKTESYSDGVPVEGTAVYYQYRIVETEVTKNNEVQSLENFSVQYSTDGASISMTNTLTNGWGVELPQTGGSGTGGFHRTGAGMILLAGIWLGIRKNRKRQEQDIGKGGDPPHV